MDQLIYFYAAVVIIAAGLAGIAIWAPRSPWVKASALVLAAALMATAYASLAELLGKPKPVSFEWAMAAAPEAEILGASLHEGEAIYVWLRFPGVPMPRAYVLPWRLQTAQELQQAMRQADVNGTTARMRRPLDSHQDPDEAQFYSAPQPPLPPKSHDSG